MQNQLGLVCVFVRLCVLTGVGGSLLFFKAIFSFLENQDSNAASFAFQICPGEDAGGGSIATLPFQKETGKGWGSEIQEPAPLEQ